MVTGLIWAGIGLLAALGVAIMVRDSRRRTLPEHRQDQRQAPVDRQWPDYAELIRRAEQRPERQP